MNQTGNNLSGFAYIVGSVLCTVYGQIIVKWQVGKAGHLPETVSERLWFLLRLVTSPWIMTGILAGFLALVCWLAAMTKFELSYAYPFMSLAFLFVLILSAICFHEPVTLAKVIGILLIIVGIAVSSLG